MKSILRFNRPVLSNSLSLILYVALALLWFVGGDRLLSPFVISTFIFYYLAKRKKHFYKNVPTQIVYFIAFLCFYLMSIFQIENTERYLTFFWDLGIYITFILVALMCYYTVNTYEDIRIRIIPLFYFTLFVNLVGFSYVFFGYWKFNSLLGFLLPAGIKSTSMGQIISVRSIGKELHFLGLGTRLSSIFSTSIHYASYLLLSIPWLIYIAQTEPKKKFLRWAIVIFSLLMLLMAQARTATLVMLGMIFVMILLSLSNKIKRLDFFSYVGSIGFFVFSFLLAFFIVFYQEILDLVELVFVVSRATSMEQRFAVYTNTFSYILQNPILGHGTQIQLDSMKYPLGSHNWYFSILFKQGVFGLLFFIMFYIGLLYRSIRILIITWRSPKYKFLSITFFIVFLGHVLLTLTLEPVVDAMHLYTLGLIAGAFIAYDKKKIYLLDEKKY